MIKIVLELDGARIELTEQQARTLYNELNNIYGLNYNWYTSTGIQYPVYDGGVTLNLGDN